MTFTATLRGTVLLLICFVAYGVSGAVSAVDAIAKNHRKPLVNTRMAIRKGDSEDIDVGRITLLGRDGDVLLARNPRNPKGVMRIHKSRVMRCEFLLDYESSDVADAVRALDWAAAVRQLSPVVRLVLPYIDVNENSGMELTMDLGLYMMASADRLIRSPKKEQRDLALRQYDAAYKLFLDAGKAEWSPFGNVALLKGCRSLLAQGKVKDAAELFGEIGPPSATDAAYGHYWLVQAELLETEDKTLEALDAVVKSVVFADKDVETFPSALLLSADCYARLEEYHRARDIYYEVAVLFTGTDWAKDALTGLAAVMEGDKTKDDESAAIENVFFNMDEDMNKLAKELLAGRAEEDKEK